MDEVSEVGDAATAMTAAALAPSMDETQAVGSGDVTKPTLGRDVPLNKGDEVGRYVVLRRLGAGGMGVVYAAYDPDLDRKVALKLLHPGSGSGEAGQRLLREAQAMAKLSHANVISVHDVGLQDGRVFVTMEFVPGATLTDWLEACDRSEREILDVFVRAGQGLAAAHARGLVHRDFKPDNVMISESGRVFVMDFGLARAVGSADQTEAAAALSEDVDTESSLARTDADLTRTGAIMGTPAYMSPEQFLAKPTDARTDQFSFCVALYEATCGRRPFAGNGVGALAMAVTQGKLEPVPRNAKISSSAARALVRGLATEPGDRWPDMQALLAELSRDPSAGRRRAWFGVGGVAALGSMLWLGARLEDPPSLCTGAADALAEIWNEERSEAIRARFEEGGRAFAAASHERVDQLLDDYAAQWTAMHTEACAATRIDGTQSDRLLDLRMACLERRAAELGALVDLLETADEALVRNSVATASSLSAIEACGDLEALQAPVPLPDDPAAREEVAALENALAGLTIKLEAGHHEEGLAEAESLVERADAVGYPPVQGDLMLLLGKFRQRTADTKGADEAYYQALDHASRGKDDVTVVRALTGLMFSVGDGQKRFDEAMQLDRMAHAAMLRAGSGANVRIMYWLSRGNVLSAKGDYEPAIEAYQKVLDLYGDLPEQHPYRARVLANMGICEVRRGRRDLAREYLERAHAIRVMSLGPDHPTLAESYNLLGVAYDVPGHRETALAHYQRAVELHRQNSGPEHPHTANAINNVGVVYHLMERYDEALAQYQQSLILREKAYGPEDAATAESVNNIADVLRLQGKYAEAIPYWQRALMIFEKTFGPDHPHTAHPLTGLGQCYLELGDTAQAREPLERALAIREAREDDVDPSDLAESRYEVARLTWERGEHAAARDLARRARDGFPEDHEKRVRVVDWLKTHSPSGD